MLRVKAMKPAYSAAVATSLLLTFLIYFPGLNGPYLFDDSWNLAPIEKWFAGKIAWQQALIQNQHSIIDSRPLAMGSFMLTTWLGGIGTFPSKLGNLILHLTCGWLVWLVALRLVRVEVRLVRNVELVALVITAIWLLHPLHVSTVLYAVQRMSQFSAISALLCVLAYLSARDSLADGHFRRAGAMLFLLFPTALAAGLLGKQNAVVAPLLCLAIECALPRTSLSEHGRKLLGAFFLCFLALPAAAVAVYLVMHPGYVLDGYRDWDFTWQQRLLTQPRVLVDYIGSILLPYSPSMGLYTDDFPKSTGLLQPASTLTALLGLGAITVLAVLGRSKFPLAFIGWAFFLIAHSIEASFLPLEMYYEHRNYLPSVGLWLAVAGVLAPVIAKPAANGRSPARLLAFAAFALSAVLAVATLGRVLVWQSFDTIVTQGVAQHPQSVRAASDAAWLALERKQYDDARIPMQRLVDTGDRRARIFGRLQLAAIDCYSGDTLDVSRLDDAASEAMSKATVYEAQVIKMFDNATLFGDCEDKPQIFAATSQRILDAATDQPETSPNKYVPREIVARLYARGGDWRRAETQAQLSWQGGSNPPTGALLAQIYLRNGKPVEAKALVAKLTEAIPAGDIGGQAALQQLRDKISAIDAPSGGSAR